MRGGSVSERKGNAGLIDGRELFEPQICEWTLDGLVREYGDARISSHNYLLGQRFDTYFEDFREFVKKLDCLPAADRNALAPGDKRT